MVVRIKLTPSSAARCLTAANVLFALYFRTRLLGAAAAGVVLCSTSTVDVPIVPIKVVKPRPSVASKPDPRAARLGKLFRTYHCPEPHHIPEYLSAADGYGLDYRLLPAVSIRETLCGVMEKQNNRWGYHPGRQTFPSIEVGIDFMARRLAEGALYKGKTTQQKLFTYNPLPEYPGEVERIMRQVD
jgi:hypothetical protein